LQHGSIVQKTESSGRKLRPGFLDTTNGINENQAAQIVLRRFASNCGRKAGWFFS
jgi:hypothetical protein